MGHNTLDLGNDPRSELFRSCLDPVFVGKERLEVSRTCRCKVLPRNRVATLDDLRSVDSVQRVVESRLEVMPAGVVKEHETSVVVVSGENVPNQLVIVIVAAQEVGHRPDKAGVVVDLLVRLGDGTPVCPTGRHDRGQHTAGLSPQEAAKRNR